MTGGGREAEILRAALIEIRSWCIDGADAIEPRNVLGQVVAVVDRALDAVRSSGSAAQTHVLENELRIAREKAAVWEREFRRVAALVSGSAAQTEQEPENGPYEVDTPTGPVTYPMPFHPSAAHTP